MTTAQEEQIAGWTINESTDLLDDSTTVTASLHAIEGLGGSLDTDPKPVFWVRCQSGKTEAYIAWHERLGDESDDLSEKKRVTYRFPPANAETEQWSISTDRTTTFVSNASLFLKSLAESEQLVVQTTPYGRSPIIVVFDLNGSADVVGRVEQAEKRYKEAQEKREREEAERKRKEAQQKELEEAVRRYKEAQEKRKREEEAERQRKEAERKREEAERQRKEMQRKQEEAERKLKEEAERQRKEAERKREEAARKREEEAERQRKEAERKQEEAERKLKEEAERQRKEAERKREEAERQRKEMQRKREEEAERKRKIQHLATNRKTATYRLCLPGVVEKLVQQGAHLACRKSLGEERVYHPDCVRSVAKESLILLKPSSVGLAILTILSGDPKGVIVALGDYCAGFWTTDKPGQIEVAVRTDAAGIGLSLWRLGDAQIDMRHTRSVVLWNAPALITAMAHPHVMSEPALLALLKPWP